jgi:hypothetical protein
VEPIEPQPVEAEAVEPQQADRAEAEPHEVVDVTILPEAVDAEAVEESTATIIDTTAELLGRATSKRPRTRATAVPRKISPRKPSGARRGSRPRKQGTTEG